MTRVFIRPVKTETDYEAALARIDVLMDAEGGTAEADELEVLAALVELYEEKHYPIGFPDPIATVRLRAEKLINQGYSTIQKLFYGLKTLCGF